MDPALQQEKLKLEIEETELDFFDFLKSFSWYSRYFFYLLVIGIIPIFFIVKYAVGGSYLAAYQARAITAHQAVLNSAPVQVIKAEILPLGGSSYSAYAQIKNPNPDLYSSDIEYTFHFQNAAGTDISTFVEHTFLLGGEAKYIVVPNVRLSAKPDQVTVDVSNAGWKRRLDLPDIKIITGIPKWGDQIGPDGFAVDGNFKNLSIYTLHTVRINGIVFGKTGNIIAVSQTNVNDLRPQEQRGYHLFWPFPLQTNVSKVETYLETNILDPANLR